MRLSLAVQFGIQLCTLATRAPRSPPRTPARIWSMPTGRTTSPGPAGMTGEGPLPRSGLLKPCRSVSAGLSACACAPDESRLPWSRPGLTRSDGSAQSRPSPRHRLRPGYGQRGSRRTRCSASAGGSGAPVPPPLRPECAPQRREIASGAASDKTASSGRADAAQGLRGDRLSCKNICTPIRKTITSKNVFAHPGFDLVPPA